MVFATRFCRTGSIAVRVGRGFIQGNPDLTPERSVQFDLTARYVAGPFQFAAAGYHYRITDLVERYASTPTLFLFRNRGLAELQGVEAEALAALPHGFTLGATAETSRGRDGVDGTPLDDVAPAATSISVRHGLSKRLSSYLRIKAVASHEAAETAAPVRCGRGTRSSTPVSARVSASISISSARCETC